MTIRDEFEGMAAALDQLRVAANRVGALAEIEEGDATTMRAAILDALEIHRTAADTPLPDDSQRYLELRAEAADEMAKRLRELSRVPVSSEMISDPELLAAFGLGGQSINAERSKALADAEAAVTTLIAKTAWASDARILGRAVKAIAALREES